MSFKVQLHENRTSITIAVVVLLCAAGLAYNQGWFSRSSPATEMESNKVSTSQTLDQDKSKADAVQVAPTTSEPAATPTE